MLKGKVSEYDVVDDEQNGFYYQRIDVAESSQQRSVVVTMTMLMFSMTVAS
jgi:hypothetical protein